MEAKYNIKCSLSLKRTQIYTQNKSQITLKRAIFLELVTHLMEVCEIVSNRAVAINPLVDKKVRESQGKMQFVSDTLWQSYDLRFLH